MTFLKTISKFYTLDKFDRPAVVNLSPLCQIDLKHNQNKLVLPRETAVIIIFINSSKVKTGNAVGL